MTDSIGSFLVEWSAAERSGDTEKLSSLLTDDFVGIGPLGFTLSKREWVGRHRQDLSYEAFAIDETEVRTYGDVAVATARDSQRGTAFGHPVPEALRTTHVLVREGDRWRLASLHMSFIAGAPGSPPLPGTPGSSPAAKE